MCAALAAAIGPALTALDPAAQDLALRLAGPSSAHWFGLDELGRDILARVLAGARISFLVGLTVVSVSASVGTLLGAVAGYVGGMTDDVISRAIDVFPVPRTPARRYAWATWPLAIAFRSVRVTCSCPTMAEKVWGR